MAGMPVGWRDNPAGLVAGNLPKNGLMYLYLLQAFTWNGFEDGTTWLGGLWAGRTTQQGDFATVVYRAQLYGFNAVRIPFR